MQNTSSTLYGRTDILSILEKRVNDLKEGYRQNIALVGQRLIGKTTLIRDFLSELNDKRIVCIYIESDNFDIKFFAKKIIGSLLNSVARSENLVPSDNLDALIQSTQKIIPKTTEHIKHIIATLDKDKAGNIYTALINLPDVFTKETNKFCIVVFDELQDIVESLGLDNAYQELSKRITVQRSCMYIITSSLRYRAKKILTENLSLLFGNFEIIDVKPFDIQTTRNFINDRLAEVKLAASLQNFLFDITAGQPFYLDVICRELLRLSRSCNEQVITLSIFSQCLHDLLYLELGYLNQQFKNCVSQINQGKSGYALLSIVFAIAKGKRRLNEITGYLRKQKTFVSQRINRLVEMDILSKNGNFFYLTDKMFNFWLKVVCLKKLESIKSLDAESNTASFISEIEKTIDGFTLTSGKSITERISDLFNLFENESVQMNGYKYRLFRFKEVNPTVFKDLNNNPGLIAHSKNIFWLILLKEDVLREEDIRKFIFECKQYKNTPQRRIIVSTGETDANAKLKALQEKIWIWNLSDLNLFLSLHDRHFIVK